MIAKGAAYLRAYSMSYKLELAGPESQNTYRRGGAGELALVEVLGKFMKYWVHNFISCFEFVYSSLINRGKVAMKQ